MSGVAATPVPIPNSPLLVGYTMFMQAAWFDGCAPAGFSASRGLAFTIQP